MAEWYRQILCYRVPPALSFFAVFAMIPLSMVTSFSPEEILINAFLIGLFIAGIPFALAAVFLAWIGLAAASQSTNWKAAVDKRA